MLDAIVASSHIFEAWSDEAWVNDGAAVRVSLIGFGRRGRGDSWIIDFGTGMTEEEAALYEKPFERVLEHVKPECIQNPRPIRAKYWWRHGDSQPATRSALAGLPRYIATAEVSKHRFFIWMNSDILPDKRLIVIARNDDATFGILSSRFHELWSLRLGATLEDRTCYRPTTCFETFPFPPVGFSPLLASPRVKEGGSEADGGLQNDAGLVSGAPENHAIALAAKTYRPGY